MPKRLSDFRPIDLAKSDSSCLLASEILILAVAVDIKGVFGIDKCL